MIKKTTIPLLIIFIVLSMGTPLFAQEIIDTVENDGFMDKLSISVYPGLRLDLSLYACGKTEIYYEVSDRFDVGLQGQVFSYTESNYPIAPPGQYYSIAASYSIGTAISFCLVAKYRFSKNIFKVVTPTVKLGGGIYNYYSYSSGSTLGYSFGIELNYEVSEKVSLIIDLPLTIFDYRDETTIDHFPHLVSSAK